MNHSIDRDLITRLFSRFASKYGKLWTTRLGENGDWEDCAQDWLRELSKFNFTEVKSAVIKALAIYRDFPPTQGQLIDLCLKESGVPDQSDVINLIVRKEFNHPIVKMVYDKVGSWLLSNGKEQEINSKVRDAYRYALADFVSDPKSCWEKLNAFMSQPKLEAPPKEENRIPPLSFKDRVAEYQKHIKEKEGDAKGHTYPEFHPDHINKNHREFSRSVFLEYKKYLLSVEEREVMGLPRHYIYDRMKFLNEIEVIALMRNAQRPENESSAREPQRRSSGKPERIYKNWMNE